jgi:hypothetical protein
VRRASPACRDAGRGEAKSRIALGHRPINEIPESLEG